jgi:hypothetical protein
MCGPKFCSMHISREVHGQGKAGPAAGEPAPAVTFKEKTG